MPSSSTTTTTSGTLREQLDRDGFVVVRGLLDPAETTALRGAAARTAALARAGGWPHVRTVGKQFPPWDAASGDGDIWGVQGLGDPALPESPAFLRCYFSEAVLGPAKQLLRCEDADLVMELHNLLVNPARADYALRWHRDDVPPEATAAEETARLAGREHQWHAQWNLALCDGDASLIVVPGSHRRARTPAERAADPYADPLPGQLAVHLDAGDAVFYDNNILHRGAYSAARERLSLHGSVGHAAAPGTARARNVLQHGIGTWVDRADLGVLDEALRPRAEAMRARLVKLGRESGEVGYSQPD